MMVRCCRCNNTIGEIDTNGKITSKCHKRVFEAEKCSITCEKCGWVTYFGQNPTVDCEHSVKQ